MIYLGLCTPLCRELLPTALFLLTLRMIVNVPEIRATRWGSQVNIRSIELCLHPVMDRDIATCERTVLGNSLGRARLALILHVDALLISLLMTGAFN